MAKRDRKTRLRPLQQTAQLQTGGLPRATSSQPKAAPLGKSNEAQMANALAQLAPSLTNFLGAKFKSDKKEGIARGGASFLKQSEEERKKTDIAISAGTYENDPYWVEGYQRSWLSNLSVSYGLGVSDLLDKIPKTSTDEEFYGAIDKYEQDFLKLNGISLYADHLVSEEFTPRTAQYKNALQQHWGAQRRQLQREQYESSFVKNVENNIIDTDLTWEQNSAFPEGLDVTKPDSLTDAIRYVPEIREILKKSHGFKTNQFTIKGDESLEELHRLLSKEVYKIDRTYKLFKEGSFNKDGLIVDIDSKSPTPISAVDESNLERLKTKLRDMPEGTRKKLGNPYELFRSFETVRELLRTKATLNKQINDYVGQTGDFSKTNLLIANKIDEMARNAEDPTYYDLIGLIETKNGTSWGTSPDAMQIIRVGKEWIANKQLTDAENQHKLDKRAEEKLVKETYAAVAPILQQAKKNELGVLLEGNEKELVQAHIRLLEGKGLFKEAKYLSGYIKDFEPYEQEELRAEFEDDVRQNKISEEQIKVKAPRLGYTGQDIDGMLKRRADSEYRQNIFKRNSTAQIALEQGMKIVGGKPVGFNKTFEEIFTSFGNTPGAQERAKKVVDYNMEVHRYARERRAELLKDKDFDQTKLLVTLTEDVAKHAQALLNDPRFKIDEAEINKLSLFQRHPEIFYEEETVIFGPNKHNFLFESEKEYTKNKYLLEKSIKENKFDLKKAEDLDKFPIFKVMYNLMTADGIDADGKDYKRFRAKPNEAFNFIITNLDKYFDSN
nr:hypothetical protein [uncultured Mediterranean phage uvMED]